MRKFAASLLIAAAILATASQPIAATAHARAHARTVYVYITKTGHKYHRAGCRYLSHSKIKVTLAKAIELGDEPCKVCNPPVK